MLESRNGKRRAIGLAAMLAALGGCAHSNDPFKDPGEAIRVELTTPNAEGFAGRAEFGRPLRRQWPETEVAAKEGDVSHWPLWWEDPFEDKGNAAPRGNETAGGLDLDPVDTEFAWSWVDYLHIAYGPGRMLLNTVSWPISAIVTHPGKLMASDGRISKGLIWYDHDARPVDSLEVDPPDVVGPSRYGGQQGAVAETSGAGAPEGSPPLEAGPPVGGEMPVEDSPPAG